MNTGLILEVLVLFRTKPDMVFNGDRNDLNSCQAFLDGYILGLGITSDVNLAYKILIWLRDRLQISYNIGWSNSLKSHYKEKPNDELINIMIQTLEDYFKENPNWYEKEI